MDKRPARRLRPIACLLAACLASCAAFSRASAQEPQTPAETVDAFHAALSAAETGRALSLLDPQAVVFEYGVVDSNANAYAFQHLPADIDISASTEEELEFRQVGGEAGLYWVLSTYHVTGSDSEGGPIDLRFMETAIVRRTGERFRIVHIHWSTDDAAASGGTDQSTAE